jgi:large subunit ribosomal protein L10
MKHAEKVKVVELIERELATATVALIAEYRGLTAGQLDGLRRAVRRAGGRCRVTKNRLAKRAASSSRHEGLTGMLRGPLALMLGFEDPIALTKAVVEFAARQPQLDIKGAVLDGTVLAPEGVKALASLPPREVLLGQLLGLLQAPATTLLRAVAAPAASLVRVLDAIGKRADPGPGAAS